MGQGITLEDFETGAAEFVAEEKTVEVTVREIYEALAKNGLKHLRGDWISHNAKGKVVGGCILQQGAYNLGVRADDSYYGDAEVDFGNIYQALNSLPVAEEHRAPNAGSNGAADSIVMWNDLTKKKADGTEYAKIQYVLPTYADVLEKARLILEPHFDKKITLPHYDY